MRICTLVEGTNIYKVKMCCAKLSIYNLSLEYYLIMGLYRLLNH